jgi:pantoate--beta-alanine ligase
MMVTLDRIDTLRAQVRAWRREGLKIGLVPTMGSLHAGHMSLLSAARFRADRVITSVFVNPLQFGPGEDFERYPRTPDDDQRMLAETGCDLLFLPSVAEMYPDGRELPTRVSVKSLSEILCGAVRPGHFDGVATVVAKLFGIVQPDFAVFGEKDYQQLAVIRRMTRDLDLPVEIVGAPTVRGADGLAMSSRNSYLSEVERQVAPRIYATLREVVARIDAGERDYAALERWGAAELERHGMRPDYFSARDALSLGPPDAATREVVVLAAARLGRARLIDNLRVALPDVPAPTAHARQ